MDAFLTGLEQARQPARTCPRSTRSPRSSSPASTPRSTSGWTRSAPTRPRRCKGKAGVANARLAYQAYEEVFSTQRWQALAADGAHTQRPLWASTGVKDPAYPRHHVRRPTWSRRTPSTPCRSKTLEAVADHGDVAGDQVTGTTTTPSRCSTTSSGSASPTTTSIARARARGRRQVREVLGRAARRRPGASSTKAATDDAVVEEGK